MNKNGIKIEGYKGSWYVISSSTYKGKNVYMLESEQYGEDVASIIVDKNLKVIKDEIWNGFSDLEE